MIQQKYTIKYEVGLHARPAGKFVKLAKGFESSIRIKNLTRAGEEVDAKSLVKVIKIACALDHEVEITFDGADEQAARNAITDFLENPQEDE